MTWSACEAKVFNATISSKLFGLKASVTLVYSMQLPYLSAIQNEQTRKAILLAAPKGFR
jgi:hypothetical protein